MVEADPVFVGLTGMYALPRQEVKDAVARCRAAGIGEVIITCEYPHTAMAIARELGIARPSDLAVAGADLDRPR